MYHAGVEARSSNKLAKRLHSVSKTEIKPIVKMHKEIGGISVKNNFRYVVQTC